MKIAPLMTEYKKYDKIEPILVHTSQHYDEEMNKLFFKQLKIPKSDINLKIGSGSHAVQTAEIRGTKIEGLVARLRTLLASQQQNLQNLSALVVFNFLAAGLFFITQIKIANVIGKEKFGLLAYGIALGMYGQTIVCYGMNRTLVRDFIHYPNRFAELVMASLLLRGLLLVLVPGLLQIPLWR